MGAANTAAPGINGYKRGLFEPNLEVVRQIANAFNTPDAYPFDTSDVVTDAILVVVSLPAKLRAKTLDLLDNFAAHGIEVTPKLRAKSKWSCWHRFVGARF